MHQRVADPTPYGEMRVHLWPSDELFIKKKNDDISLFLSPCIVHMCLFPICSSSFFFCFSSYSYILNCHHDFEYSTMRIDIQNHGSLHLCEHESVDKRTDRVSFRFMFSFSSRTFTPSLPSLSLSLSATPVASICIRHIPTHASSLLRSRTCASACTIVRSLTFPHPINKCATCRAHSCHIAINVIVCRVSVRHTLTLASSKIISTSISFSAIYMPMIMSRGSRCSWPSSFPRRRYCPSTSFA